MILGLFLFFICVHQVTAQTYQPVPPNPDKHQPDVWVELVAHPDTWFASDEAAQIAENVLLYQRKSGGWPKNIDMTKSLPESQKNELREYGDEPFATIDNSATYTQLYFLALLVQKQPEQRYILSFLRGIDYLLKAQYDNGGWPQFFPLRQGYYTHITFNDEAMIGVMHLLKDIVDYPKIYYFVDSERREKSKRAVEKGIACILRTQVKVHNTLTVWCAQYDEITLKPANARAYELISLSGKESVGIVQFLMTLKNPSPEIIQSITSAVKWFKKVELTGIRQIRVPNAESPNGFNKVIVKDPNAPPIWARFYTIDTNTPFFSDRDGKMYSHLEDISMERRNEYGWLGYWPKNLVGKEYNLWLKKWNIHASDNN